LICLDTNVLIDVMRGVEPVRRRLEWALISGEAVAASSIVLFELWAGVRKSARPELQELRLQALLGLGVAILDFDQEDAAEAGAIRAALERAGEPIGPYDLLIAAQARRRRATIATANASEFRRVPDLVIEAWGRT
jgi:tRNA(fMet)-specific endonuclease VapC